MELVVELLVVELVGRLCFVKRRIVFVIADLVTGRLELVVVVELVVELVVGRVIVELVVVELVKLVVNLVGRLCLLNGRIVV